MPVFGESPRLYRSRKRNGDPRVEAHFKRVWAQRPRKARKIYDGKKPSRKMAFKNPANPLILGYF
jgi:hypothetical protein